MHSADPDWDNETLLGSNCLSVTDSYAWWMLVHNSVSHTTKDIARLQSMLLYRDCSYSNCHSNCHSNCVNIFVSAPLLCLHPKLNSQLSDRLTLADIQHHHWIQPEQQWQWTSLHPLHQILLFQITLEKKQMTCTCTWCGFEIAIVTVLGRNQTLFCCVFWSHYHIRSAVVQNLHYGHDEQPVLSQNSVNALECQSYIS